MFCKNCGNQIKDGVRFCPQCGKETGISMTQEEIKEPKEAAGFSRGSRTPLRKNRRYVTTYNVGHFGVLIGCVIQAVALFMPNYTTGFLAQIVGKISHTLGSTPSLAKFYSTFYLDTHSEELREFSQSLLGGTDLYTVFDEFLGVIGFGMFATMVLLLLLFLFTMRKGQPIFLAILNMGVVSMLLYYFGRFTSVFEGTGFLMLLTGGVVILLSSIVAFMLRYNAVQKQKINMENF